MLETGEIILPRKEHTNWLYNMKLSLRKHTLTNNIKDLKRGHGMEESKENIGRLGGRKEGKYVIIL